MTKLIRLEWIKFTQSRKNRMIIILLVLYIVGVVFYYNQQHKTHFSRMEKALKEERNNAISRINIIELFARDNENYEVDTLELEFLNTEVKKTIVLEYFYKEQNFKDWQRNLNIENEKFSNLIWGEKNGFINKSVLDARGQNTLDLKATIMKNEYLIMENIALYTNPYELNGSNFLVIFLKGYHPVILIIFLVLISIDLFLGEMEEGSYKLYFTQPFSRKDIYWSKILSISLFTIGIISLIIVIGFIIISLIYGLGNFKYPQVISSTKASLSLMSNAKILGEFQIISTLRYIILGYLSLFIISTMFIIFTISLSIILNSITITIGAFTCIILGDYVFDIFLENESIFRFYSPLSYMKVNQVLSGQVNTSYIMGIIIALVSNILMTIYSCNRFIDKDF